MISSRNPCFHVLRHAKGKPKSSEYEDFKNVSKRIIEGKRKLRTKQDHGTFLALLPDPGFLTIERLQQEPTSAVEQRPRSPPPAPPQSIMEPASDPL